MSLKTIDQSPSITDEVKFELTTTDADSCVVSPYKISTVKIYYLEKEFSGKNFTEYDRDIISQELVLQLEEAQELLCASPTDENLASVERISNEIDQSKQTNTFYYKQAIPVKIFGNVDAVTGENYPAWMNPGQVPESERESVIEDNILTPATDDNDVPIAGMFNLIWEPIGQREGDYFVCWTWAPNIAGDSLSAHEFFRLRCDTKLTTTLPTQGTDPDKYTTLLERYTPNVYRGLLGEKDLSPFVVEGFNGAVAKGFTDLEDQANQILGLIDANVLPESLLSLLGNFFNLKLRTADPTLWRRQIKEAIPLYKMKGTRRGLDTALGQAAMSLKSFTRLWQVISHYTWQELFDVENDGQTEFTLSKTAITDLANTEVYYRGENDTTWTTLSADYVTITATTATWVGGDLSVNPVTLGEDDSIRIIYKIADVPDSTAQTLEEYVRTLDLDDQRDERSQCYPPKNWNVRVIEEDDPLFDLIIPVKHPLHDPLVFGWVRTEFPYSENIYNMEEYNGSTRESFDPCNIDREFIDPCRDCLGSKYIIDVDIEDLTNDRVLEATDIFDEYLPVHATLHSMNFTGTINDFVHSPTEEILILMHYFGEEIVLSGEGQRIFSRSVPQEDALSLMKRNMLANVTTKATTQAGTAYNISTVIVSSGTSTVGDTIKGYRVNFSNTGVNTGSVSGAALDNSNWLEILAPHALSGNYSINNIDGFMADVIIPSGTEASNQTQFVFRLSNRIIDGNPVSITQDDYFTFNDSDVNFPALGVQTQWDVDEGIYTGTPWSLTVTSSGGGTWTVGHMLPDGSLVLEDDGTLPTSDITGMTWLIEDGNGTTRATGTEGALSVRRRATVDFSAVTSLDDIRNYANISDYVLYGGSQYEVIGFVEGDVHMLYIDGYTGGSVAGVAVTVYRRLSADGIGQFEYRGLQLDTGGTDYEATLPVSNGVNLVSGPLIDGIVNNDLKENYLLLIDTEYFAINEIDGTTITLDGPPNDWGVAAGTAVTFDIYQYEKEGVVIPAREDPEIPGHAFEYVDRGGLPIFEYDTEYGTSMYMYGASMAMRILNAASASGTDNVLDVTGQQESVSYKIDYDDGRTEEGEI